MAFSSATDSWKPDDVETMLELLQTSLVKPIKPTKRHIMYLSGVDNMLGYLPPNRTILFYREEKTSSSAVADLQIALSSLLVSYYPLAGRIILGDDGRHALDCNDEGVELTEARCDMEFAELQRDNFNMHPVFRRLVPMDDATVSNHPHDPIVSIQVTGFRGGLTVGFAVLHSVGDGYSVWNFIKALSEVCRDQPLSLHPLHARMLLKPEVFKNGAIFTKEECRSADEDVPQLGVQLSSEEQDNNIEPLKQVVIHFSSTMLSVLRKLGVPQGSDSEPGILVSILGAYLWRRLVIAQRLGEKSTTEFRVSMDIRSRMIPPLTPSFFGNAVVGFPLTLTVGELINGDLSQLASSIRCKLKEAEDDHIKELLIARHDFHLSKYQPTRRKVIVRNASRFPVYDAGDFGWGKPETVRPPWEEMEGHMTWYPGKEPKSIDVIVAMAESTYTNFFSTDLYVGDPLSSFPLCTSS
ncbi:hypothetical protein KP509_20G023300 [Ceratopteris richardii]|uniref:Uncharacterized protein n=1 Tax=Ceratopteris richardii TaxID=49495 RepID=A0A8T2SFX1_CERRI|nr:hypothetical protein KP509_20G023300 [Ceratopteris richardii]KAH7331267.1 hypothetical protein KP509_20G023300 [Ceratopteris richardii]